MSFLSNLIRHKSDPKIVTAGPSVVSGADKLACALGWVSLGLGALELVAPRRIAKLLGMPEAEGVIRAYGAREIGAGLMTLSTEKNAGLKSRVCGDMLDIATLSAGLHAGNAKRGNVKLALAAVIGIAALDLMAAQAVAQQHGRKPSDGKRDYSDRSGFPKGVTAAHGVARKSAGLLAPPS